MILRVTGQLAKQIGVSVKESPPMASNPYQDWTCRPFSASYGGSYMLVTNTASLYTLLIPWSEPIELESFQNILFADMRRHLKEDGFGAVYTAYIEPFESEARLAKTLNRSITGSMNDMIRMAEHMLAQENKTLYETSNRLNETPFGILDYDHPRDRFAALATRLVSR